MLGKFLLVSEKRQDWDGWCVDDERLVSSDVCMVWSLSTLCWGLSYGKCSALSPFLKNKFKNCESCKKRDEEYWKDNCWVEGQNWWGFSKLSSGTGLTSKAEVKNRSILTKFNDEVKRGGEQGSCTENCSMVWASVQLFYLPIWSSLGLVCVGNLSSRSLPVENEDVDLLVHHKMSLRY